MKIDMIHVPVRELIEGYSEDDATSRVVAWGGKLDVRPEFQREFVYNDKQQEAVVNTILNGFPLNIMYFVDRQDGGYEVLDGQQRIISVCRFALTKFSVKIPAAAGGFNSVNYPNLFDEQKARFLDYELQVYICEGTDKEKLDWFQIINIAGEELEKQEILNAIYHSKWLTDAKSAFSRRNCVAHKNYGKYMGGDYIRQKYLETVFSWAADAEGISGKDAVAEYMQKHRYDDNADSLWKYFEDVFKWVGRVFGPYDKRMKGRPWGMFYNRHKDDNLDPAEIQAEIKCLMNDDEVQKYEGVYEYLLSNRTRADEKCLNLRKFDDRQRQIMYSRQDGKCAICGKPFDISEMHGDHVTPWSKGGKTTLENGQMLCAACNLKKSNA